MLKLFFYVLILIGSLYAILEFFPRHFNMADLSEILLQGISKKLDKLIECVKELIKILGGK